MPIYNPDVTEQDLIPYKRRSIWCQAQLGTGTREHYGAHTGILVDAAAETACIEIKIPADYDTFVSCYVYRIANATATHRLNYNTQYCSAGEAYNQHTQQIPDIDTAETAGVLYTYDIAAGLSNLYSDDVLVIQVMGDGTNTPDDIILGAEIIYDIA